MLRTTVDKLKDAVGPVNEASTLTYDTLFRMSDPKRVWRSGQVRGPPMEIDGYKDAIFHTFNFKSFPSTTGLRHRGYIKFEKPKNGKPTVAEKLPVVVDCGCPDFRYRWAWSNKQRGASRVGTQSLNQAHDRAPVKTNPSNKVGLCKHLLAARDYIFGTIEQFGGDNASVDDSGEDIAYKLDKLVKHANKRWINWSTELANAKQRKTMQRMVSQARNIAGPMAAAEVPKNIDKEHPTPLPGEEALPPEEPNPEEQAALHPNQPKPQAVKQPEVKQPPAKKPEAPPVTPPANVRPNQKPEESSVVNVTANNRIVDTMNRNLLNRTRALVEALEDDSAMDINAAPEMGAEGEGDFDTAGALPPPPMDDEEGMDTSMGAEGAPEDEALGLLRDIAAGISRLADELAPSEEIGAGDFDTEEPEEEEEEADEPKEDEEDEAGVPPVEDDDDSDETMPVASGA